MEPQDSMLTGGMGSIPLHQAPGCYHLGHRLQAQEILIHRLNFLVAVALHVIAEDSDHVGLQETRSILESVSGITSNFQPPGITRIIRLMVIHIRVILTRRIHRAQDGDCHHTCQCGIIME